MKNFIFKWSKKERDWWWWYPSRTGKVIGGIFGHAMKDMDKWVQSLGVDYKDFRDYLDKSGYDPDSLRISLKLKKPV